METLSKIQNDTKDRINKGLVNFKKSPKDRITLSYIETRLEILESDWKSFCETHSDIIAKSDRSVLLKSDYYVSSVYDKTEDIYIEYKCGLKDALSNLKSVTKLELSNTNRNSDCSSVKLPKISIPTFSGKYTEWTTFRDLFVVLVHNNGSLENVQKMHYLKAHLIGEAEQLLRHIPVTSANYNECWSLLNSRYDNKKYLANCLLKRFMGQPNVPESSRAIKELLDTTVDCLNGLKNIGVDVSTWDTIVIYVVSSKLDDESRKQWESKISTSEDLPTFTQFKEFLEHKFRSLEFLDTRSRSRILPKSNVLHVVNSNNKPGNIDIKCQFCNGSHKLLNCKQFASQEYESRKDFVQTNRLCYNCLGKNHSVYTCRQSTRCRICKKKHHSLLHPKFVSKPNENDVSDGKGIIPSTSKSQDESTNIVTSCLSNVIGQVLLATALVKVASSSGVDVTLRCLLDQGSQASFITESVVQTLGLKKVPTKVVISGVGNCVMSKYIVNIKLQSLYDPDFTIDVKVHVLNKLTTVLPSKRITVPSWSELAKMKLADPKFHVPGKVDLLLGAEVYGQILEVGLIKGPPGSPVAQNTKLGWILSGQIHSESLIDSKLCLHNSITSMYSQVDDNDLLKRFWELESDNFPSNQSRSFTPEQQKCEEIFLNTTSRDETGRYIVNLPFRDEDPKCKYGNSKEIAGRRLNSLEKRLAKIPELKSQYTAVMQEYIDLDHMELIPENERGASDAVYLPHHAVIREDKTTSKVRVVFDASCLGTNGVSLNNDLLVGPTLQSDLRDIILRWRLHPIVLVADIVKMYRQVRINKNHCDFQRVLWRDNSGVIQHYRLLRVTFGTASAPYLAVRVLHQLAIDEGGHLKDASDRTIRNFYMDDLMTGCQTVEESLKVYDEMRELMMRGGFELQKWDSNSQEVVEKIGDTNIKEKRRLNIGIEKGVNFVRKVLGLNWDSKVDEFEYSIELSTVDHPITKRKVLADISRLFDPLGWISPVIINAKVFIQKLWMSGIDWDEELPPHLLQEWINYRNNLSNLTGFKIPRWIRMKEDDQGIELHGFSDASSAAYSAVVYARVIDSTGNIYTSLITSKTKVAPIIQRSIPRLELCGAVLLAHLLTDVAGVLSIPKSHIHAWTDSSVVLAWLSSHPSKWQTFVANRTSEILSIMDRNQWSHVRSKENPADCASRGVKPSEVLDLRLWKLGPTWLTNVAIEYSPQFNNDPESPEVKAEEKTKKVCHSATVCGSGEEFVCRFSSLRKLIRITALCKRFIHLARVKPSNFPTWLTCIELQSSLEIWIKQCQHQYLGEEIGNIIRSGTVSKKSKVASLSPFLDDKGILRVGGRLHKATINETMKHPILIPRQSHLAKLIVGEAHERTLHGGPLLMLNYIRCRYWLVNAKDLVKYFIRKCVTCIRYSSKSHQPLMGQLPASRITPCKPFYNSGVDYAGPIAIRTSKGRGHHATKGYICLFICMATRAIHLEVVSDMSSGTFLAAYKRFVARRGRCANLWSDNGTTFVGAAKELKWLAELEKSTMLPEIVNWFAHNGTNWHKIPPYAPNFGGLWEAGIKSTKFHLKRVLGTSTLTFEEITTVLAQIEACLNSRPISQVSDNVQDPFPLTPGHFLVGEPLLLVPEANYETSNVNSLKRWQLSQRMVQGFWRRWSSEYLTQFLQRHKWRDQTSEPKIGDVVLVKEDNLPPARWVYGVVIKKHTGEDGVTRVVSLRCGHTEIKRSMSKLCILPITD